MISNKQLLTINSISYMNAYSFETLRVTVLIRKSYKF